MKLLLSLELTQLDKALAFATEVQHAVDIIEIGTLLIYKYGEQAITEFRSAFPEKIILADYKIADRGKEASRIALQAGADWVTVLAGTSRNVINAVSNTAHDAGKKVMLDLIDARSSGQSALEAQNLGVDALIFHRPSDEQNSEISFEQWEMIKGNTKLPIYISTTVTRENLSTLMQLKPDGLILNKHSEKELSAEDVTYFSSITRELN